MDFDFSYIDIAFIHGKVITVNANDDIVEAVGVKGDKIVYVGSSDELLSIASESTQIIDLKGRTLMPGFIDCHYHPILNGLFGDGQGAAIINIAYDQCRSIEEILLLIKKAAAIKEPGERISLMGYDQNIIKEHRHPTLDELDAAAPENPVQCMRACGHICIYNSKALAAIGVYTARDASFYPENEIVVENGKLTGMVKDHTHFLIWSKVCYTNEQQTEAAIKSNQLLLRNGITSVHDAGEFGPASYKIMQRLCRERKFKPRVYMMLHSVFGKSFSEEENQHFLSLGLETGLGDAYFRIGCSKFMIDGGSSGPSCATREPYSHDGEMLGILAWKRQETADYIKMLNDAGCQATAHAVGDLAVEYMVEGYEDAFSTNPRPELRHRIEHTAIVDEDLIARMKKLNIFPCCNPGFIAWNGSNYARYFGQRMKYFMALRSMIDAGVNVCLGSDAPSGPLSPLTIIDACVNRIDRTTNEPVDQTQCMSVMEAIRLYTINGAMASVEEDIKGSIEVGKLADMVVLSENILTFPKEKIIDIHVDLTMIGGIIEFNRIDMKLENATRCGR